MSKVTLQQASIKDIPLISQLGLTSYWDHYRYLWIDDLYAKWYMERSFSTHNLYAQMEDKHAVFFVIYNNDLPGGMIKINNGKGYYGYDAKAIELEKIYLLKTIAGMGVGTKALEQLIGYMIDHSFTKMWLKSMDSSPSLGFYKKAGFIKIGEERLPFEGFKEEYRGMHVLELTLPANKKK